MPFKKEKLARCAGALVCTLFCASALSACEFGNKSTTTLTGYDTISGFYSSLPQSVSFRAKIGTEAERNVPSTVLHIPAFIKAVMANPTMLYFDDPIGGTGSLRSHLDSEVGFATRIQDKAGTFGLSNTAYAEVSGCRFQQDIVHSGTFSQSATTTVVSDVKVRGQMSIDYALTYSLIGDDADCDNMRAAFLSCYTNDIGCSTNTGSIFYKPFIQLVFDPLIEAGVMTVSEIGSARLVSYRVVYE
jgi:hypothetical protein